jgi:predicted transcriptional regulator
MAHITANDLKTRGIAAIEACLAEGRTEALVSVRGADRYVVMELAQYQYLRECELEAALSESRADIEAGRFVVESPAAHVARLQAMIASEAAPGPAASRPARARPGKLPARAPRKSAKPAKRPAR